MANSTIIAIAWPATLVIAVIAGRMIAPPNDDNQHINNSIRTTAQSEPDNSHLKVNQPDQDRKRKGGLSKHRGHAGSAKSLACIEDDFERLSQLMFLVNKLGKDDFQSFIDEYRTNCDISGRMSEIGILMTAWAKVDPEATLAHIGKNKSLKGLERKVLATWASMSPTAALHWVQSNFEGLKLHKQMIGVIKGIAKVDLARATELLQTLPEGGSRSTALYEMLPGLAQLGIKGALKWTNEISDSTLKAEARNQLITELAKVDPQGSAALIKGLDGIERSSAISTIIKNWGKDNPEETLKWINQLDEKELTNGTQQLLKTIARTDAEKASEWLDRYKEHKNYPQFVSSFINTAFIRDPSTALSQVKNLPEGQRDQLEKSVLRFWHLTEPTAADEWMKQSSMTPEEINDLKNSKERFQMMVTDMEDAKALMKIVEEQGGFPSQQGKVPGSTKTETPPHSK